MVTPVKISEVKKVIELTKEKQKTVDLGIAKARISEKLSQRSSARK